MYAETCFQPCPPEQDAGSKTLSLSDGGHGWSVGDRLLLPSSSFNPRQVRRATSVPSFLVHGGCSAVQSAVCDWKMALMHPEGQSSAACSSCIALPSCMHFPCMCAFACITSTGFPCVPMCPTPKGGVWHSQQPPHHVQVYLFSFCVHPLQAEFGTISAISGDGKTVTLSDALQHNHSAMIKTYSGTSVTLDARTEVNYEQHNHSAMLSHTPIPLSPSMGAQR